MKAPEEDRIKVTFKDVVVILTPYTWNRLREQLISVLPIVLYLLSFQLIVLMRSVSDAISITIGIVFVILGLMFFMEGLRLGLMPFGETIGATLPVKSSLPLLLLFAFMVGIGTTLAEPAIGTLKAAGEWVDAEKAKLLYYILNYKTTYLVVSVGVGVGIAAVLGIIRFLKNLSLAVFIYPSVILCSLLTILAFLNPKTASIVGLAWDCGAVTTGPVTVPIVLSLGMGVCRITGKSDTGMSGFGIVTLASLFPIIAVLSLGLILFYGGFVPFDEVVNEVEQVARTVCTNGSRDLIATSISSAFRAIIPLFVFLYLFQTIVLKERVEKRNEIFLGIGFATFGMILFNFGLFTGLSALGVQVGTTVPVAFHPPEGSLYGVTLGKAIAIIFGFIMGYGATLAEPALNALGIKVEEITIGAFKKVLLMHAVAAGVAVGIGLGVVKFIFDIPLIYMLLPPYLLLLLLTFLSKESYINIGWDSAGVTTGPITVPLVIAMGLGIGKSIGVIEAFGILSMASVCPIITVLSLGLIVSRRRTVYET